jgi:tRNA 5-methylaminomethyl-2-thiouridine biosynthesis bifunctional protein
LKNSSSANTCQQARQHQALLQQARINWDKQGQPISEEFDDVYFNTDSGIDESRYVFITPSNLQSRWQKHQGSFTLVETGFGTGLNFILTWLEWKAFQQKREHKQEQKGQQESNHLHYISIEKYPLDKHQLKRALALFPELQELSAQLIDNYPLLLPGFHSLQFKDQNLSLTLVFDDVNTALPQLNGPIDSWYLDGFAPAKNPDMWTDELYQNITRLSRANTHLATFTAAGDVRRGLSAAGFKLNKVSGFGMKREMMNGKYIQSQGPLLSPFETTKPWIKPDAKIISQVAIIGAGIAGCTTAYALAQRGLKVTLIDRHGIATEASGNPQGAMYAKLAAGEATHSKIYIQGYLQSLRWLNSTLDKGDGWDDCGLIQLASTEKELNRQKKFIANTHYPKELLQSLDAEQASNISGVNLNTGGLFFPAAGWVSPQKFCQQLVKHPLIDVQQDKAIELIQQQDQWLLETQQTRKLGLTKQVYSHVVIACANDSQALLKQSYLPTKSIRGQLTYLDSSANTNKLKTVLCGKGYIAPANNGKLCLGASYNIKDDENQMRLEDHQKNLQYLDDFGQEFEQLHQELQTANAHEYPGRTGFRCTTPDYLPMTGPLINEEDFDQSFSAIRKNLARYPRQAAKFHSGLYLNIGHGSRGLTSAPLCAELIASYICDENFPLAKDHAEALLPGRFYIREMVRNKR